MSILEYESFKDAVAERERTICIDLLRQSPELTLGELAQLAKGALANVLAKITVGDLTRNEPAAQTETATAKAPGRSVPADVRTPAGRARYEGSLLSALAEEPDFTGVATLTEKVGGTNLQARAALNRLIKAGRVTWTGRARGTRYRLASHASQ